MIVRMLVFFAMSILIAGSAILDNSGQIFVSTWKNYAVLKRAQDKHWLNFCCCYYKYDSQAIKFFKLGEGIRMHWANFPGCPLCWFCGENKVNWSHKEVDKNTSEYFKVYFLYKVNFWQLHIWKLIINI